ncbi:ArsA family ATPase [Ilumatobacter nonamiensis]|uniref:ArsA family ATPase n=1 Tax=Ilumatobacter nonamiensis TaxID=467093 RepID=UPI0011D19FD6|nr:ArsA-related P-loop ATPase [Ilumatobacter nonamiensis]
MNTVDTQWLTSAHVMIVAGKGGVGSSTVAAAAAVAAARDGADVLFIAVDGRPGMGALLGGREISDREQTMQRVDGGGRIRARSIPADQAFGDYLELKGVGGLLRRAASSASLPMIAAATPGLEHLLVLGKIKELEKEGVADLIVVDAPPAGHATPFIRSASGLSDVVKSGPVLEQAEEVAEMLADPQRCKALLVALPEETPITELMELATDLGDDLGLGLLPLVVNACWPDRSGLDKSPAMAARSHKLKLSDSAKSALESAADFGRSRLAQQREQIERLTEARDEPIITLPRLATPRLSPDDLAILADALVPDDE